MHLRALLTANLGFEACVVAEDEASTGWAARVVHGIRIVCDPMLTMNLRKWRRGIFEGQAAT